MGEAKAVDDAATRATNRDSWLGIELRHFSALAAVASESSFRGAADRLGYVQSAISRQIAFLEQLTGARLIERSRSPRPVHLTDAGEILLTHARQILASIDAAKADLETVASGRVGDVRIGVFPGAPTRILSWTLLSLGTRRHGLTILPTERSSDESFFELVRQGGVDLAFVHLPVDPGPFTSYELFRIPWVLVVPAGAEIAKRSEALTLADIARLPLILPRSPRLTQGIESRLCEVGCRARVVYRSDVSATTQTLAGAGVGAAPVPALAADVRDPRTRIIGLNDMFAPLELGLVWHRHRHLHQGVVEFRELIRSVCSEAPRERSSGRFVSQPLVESLDE